MVLAVSAVVARFSASKFVIVVVAVAPIVPVNATVSTFMDSSVAAKMRGVSAFDRTVLKPAITAKVAGNAAAGG